MKKVREPAFFFDGHNDGHFTAVFGRWMPVDNEHSAYKHENEDWYCYPQTVSNGQEHVWVIGHTIGSKEGYWVGAVCYGSLHPPTRLPAYPHTHPLGQPTNQPTDIPTNQQTNTTTPGGEGG